MRSRPLSDVKSSSRVVRLGIAAVAVLAAAACARGEGRPSRSESAAAAQAGTEVTLAAEATDTVSWPRFTLRVPRGTRRKVSEECPGGRLVGPIQRDSAGRALPRFDLCVESHAKPAAQPLAAWVDSVRAERNRTLDEDARLDRADTVTIGATPMLRLQPFCGDCESYEYYAAAGDRVAVFSFSTGAHLAGSRDRQEAMHLAVLRSLRWR